MTSSPAVEEVRSCSCFASWVNLILQRLGGVDHRSLRARFHVDELGAHVDALLQGRNEVFLRCDDLAQFLSASAAFCRRSASNAATAAANCPRSAASTRFSRSRNAGATPSGHSIVEAESRRCDWALKSAVFRRRISALADASSARAPFRVV